MLRMHKLDYAINKNDLLIQSAVLSKDDPKQAPGAYCAVVNQVFDDQDPNFSKTKFAGVSLGHAEAHGNTGDDAMAVMMGGTITLRNGPEKINAGEQIYWGVRLANETRDDKYYRGKSNTAQIHIRHK
jgi:hypothetical protein